jgi:hydroxyacylglutathione hydrolase
MKAIPAAGPVPPLEDELGDVLEKALRRSALAEDALARASGVPAGKIRDAIDYRPDLTMDEIRRLAEALGLNEVGLCALGCGQYPLPEVDGLPFSIWPIPMPHGIGVVNAYIVAGDGAGESLLFDTGAGMTALARNWPEQVRDLAAVFLTHVESEHAGALCAVISRFGATSAYIPQGASAPCGLPAGEGAVLEFGSLEVTVFGTPGHAAAHNCYLVRSSAPASRALLVSGDLVFAGSAGGGYFCHRQLKTHLRRVLEAVPPSTVIAPGHGPLTTVENELRFNPFLS